MKILKLMWMSKLKITLNFMGEKKAPQYIFGEHQTKSNFLGTQVFLNAEYKALFGFYLFIFIIHHSSLNFHHSSLITKVFGPKSGYPWTGHKSGFLCVKTRHLNIFSEPLEPGFNPKNWPNRGPVQPVKELTFTF